MRIYFYAHAWHHLQNIEPVIRELERRGIGYQFLMFTPRDDNYPRVERLFPGARMKILAESPTFRIGQRLTALGKPGKLLGLLWSFFWLVIYFGWQRPARLVVTEDITLWSNLTTQAARLWRIPRIHLPLENIHFAEHRMGTRLREGRILPEHQSWLQRLAHRLYPINVQRYQGKLLYWYTPYRILASYPLRLLPGSPWIRGSNNIDRVAVNSRVQMEENARYGLAADRQVITGFPMHDQLVECLHQRETIKSRVMAQLGLVGDMKICLVVGTNPPVLWTEEQLPYAYQAHSELLQTLSDALGKDYVILFKVHPWQDQEDFIKKIGGGEPAVVLKNEFSVYELLTVSDLVLMFKSSTVIASQALDIPVLAYGIYDLPGMPEFYNRYTSIEQAYSLDDIRRIIQKIEDPAYQEDLKHRRAADRAQYGMFDGNNTKRMAEVILS